MYRANNRNVTAKGGQRQTVEKLNFKENCHCEGRSPVAIRSPNLTVLDALQPKWKHFGERIATSGCALLAMTAFFDTLM